MSTDLGVEQFLSVGQKWSRRSYGTIIGIDKWSGEVQVRNEDGQEWTVSRKIFDAEFVVANLAETRTVVSRTELLQKLLEATGIAVTICFRKKPDANKIANELAEFCKSHINDSPLAQPAKTLAVKSVIKNLLVGERRVIVGRHYSNYDEHGRLFFVDMEASGPHNTRTVDPRTVEWAIIDGTLYEVWVHQIRSRGC